MKRTSLAEEGRNCWRRSHADRLTWLIDGESYFPALKQALRNARHSIFLIGWEIDSRTAMDRTPSATEPNRLADLLDDILTQNADLTCHMLIWDPALIYSLIYSFDREFLPEMRLNWLSNPRLKFKLDDAHPLGASHHQKIVVIDDRLAFIGGLDITSRRWDSRQHLPKDSRRSDETTTDYDPFHDVQVMIEGRAAADLGDLARDRWQCATGETIAPPPPKLPSPWPEGWAEDLRDAVTAIARTAPNWQGTAEAREVQKLYLDMIGAAKGAIYMENQYFASPLIGQAIARRLAEEDPPEIVVIGPDEPESLLEQTSMAAPRQRLFGQIKQADHRDRFRMYCPFSQDRPVKVHAKLMIVDDRMLRVGSANLNKRSLGVDTECDLLAEASDDRQHKGIADFRADLLAEHLGCDKASLAQAIADEGMIAAITRFNGDAGRHLVPFEEIKREAIDLGPANPIFDPDEPFEELIEDDEEWDDNPAPAERWRSYVMYGLLIFALVMAAGFALMGDPAGRIEPAMKAAEGLRGNVFAPLIIMALFVVGGIIAVPVSAMIALAGMLFGPIEAMIGTLGGSLLSASVVYYLGHLFGRDAFRRMAGGRVERLSRNAARNGILAVTALRLVPLAPFAIVNLVAGGSHIRFRDFLVGTAIGMFPGILGFSIFGDRLAAVLRDPQPGNVLLLIAVATAVFGSGWWLSWRIRRSRRFAPLDRKN